jgi:hypothetical protein
MKIMAIHLDTSDPVHRISRLRYDSLAGYARRLGAYVLSDELAWFEHQNGRVLGALIRDRTDSDFGGIIMGRDESGCFRCVEVTTFSDSIEIARNQLRARMGSWSARPDADFVQGDARPNVGNFFTPVVAAHKLDPAFVRIATSEQFSPARALMEAMMPYYTDIDGNFVEQFQTVGFDSRFWELYNFALLNEQKFNFDRGYNAPDFVCSGLYQDIFVEAVTVGPTRHGSLVVEQLPGSSTNVHEYLTQYMPIKWAGALTAKLQKKYWTLSHVIGKPVVFAIQDFHLPRAMTFTATTLVPYLYGRAATAVYDATDKLHVRTSRVLEHRWGTKVIQSGFFDLPAARWISAVLQNPTATISKFNRMARLAKLGSMTVKMWRFGTAYRDDPNAAHPVRFFHDVDDPSYRETWTQGLNVYHNPNALFPLDPGLFEGAMHHRLEGDDVVHSIPQFHPYSSETIMVVPQPESAVPSRELGVVRPTALHLMVPNSNAHTHNA